MSWMIRIHRYDGSESTIKSGLSEEQAVAEAAALNTDTQSGQYRAEEYDQSKAAQFLAPARQILKEHQL